MALRSLRAKLSAVFFVLVCANSLIYLALSGTATRLHLQEVDQKLNRSLARNIVAETPLLSDGKVNRPALDHLFRTLMVINPNIEVYLVDADGAVLAFHAEPGKVKRSRISLAPVRAFLSGREAFPIRGDDPRDPARTKVFSAAPITDGDRLAGYLYIVLGGEAYESTAAMIGDSTVLTFAVAAAAVSLVLALAAGLVSFSRLTRRLRRLGAAVDGFRRGDFQAPMALVPWRRGAAADEIDTLGVTVETMSRRIVDQIERLREADASRRDMVANISHDLRTPLTALQGYLETLSMKEGRLSADERHHYLELAAKHARRLGRLTAELFELATLESQARTLNVERFSLAELVQDVAQKFRFAAETRRIRLETEIVNGAPFVSGDIGLIERALANLIENAIKYTPEDGVVRLTLIENAERVAARVSDTGVGIPEGDIPHIFDRFYRVEKSRSEGPEGTGLGLAIAQRILRLHGSSIEVESTPGSGTSFTFALPVAA